MNSETKLGRPANIFWIAVSGICALVWSFGPQTRDWNEAKQMGKSEPCLKNGLRPLANEAADTAPGGKEWLFGYEFEVPWSKSETEVIRQNATVISQNGQALIFWDPAETLQLFSETDKPERHPNVKDAFGAIIGKDAAQSNYELLAHMLKTTPEQISPIISKREANGRLALLRMKLTYCSTGRPAFYSFQSKSLRCIQIGEPGIDRVIEVNCFDVSDRKLNFHFSSKDNSRSPITQGQINRVMQTLHPAENPSLDHADQANVGKN